MALREHLDPVEAEIITGLLRSSGIPVMEKREAVGVVYQFRVGPVGEVRLYVPLHRAAEAEILLKALALERHDEPLDTGGEPGEPGNADDAGEPGDPAREH